MERKSIGSFIAALRRANGMTQKELAEKLSVSDKAVSRWERDESLPDLLLLPLIADIFHITVDELLRGERKTEDVEAAVSFTDAARLKKQTKRVLAIQLNRLRNRDFIALGIGALGLLAAIICNFALLQGFVGFCVGVICVTLAAVMTAFFHQGAIQAADDEELDAQCVHGYRESVIGWTRRMTVIFCAMLSFCLPMILAYLGNISGYRDVFVTEGGWLLYSLMCLVTLETAAAYVFWRLDQKKNVLHGIVVRTVCAVMALTLLSFALVPEVALLAREYGDTYTDVDIFLAEMNKRWEEERKYGYYGVSALSVALPLEVDETGDVFLEYLYDKDGNVIASYHRPPSVTGIRCTRNSSYEITQIQVMDERDYNRAVNMRLTVNTLISMAYVLEPMLGFGVYSLLKKKR